MHLLRKRVAETENYYRTDAEKLKSIIKRGLPKNDTRTQWKKILAIDIKIRKKITKKKQFILPNCTQKHFLRADKFFHTSMKNEKQ